MKAALIELVERHIALTEYMAGRSRSLTARLSPEQVDNPDPATGRTPRETLAAAEAALERALSLRSWVHANVLVDESRQAVEADLRGLMHAINAIERDTGLTPSFAASVRTHCNGIARSAGLTLRFGSNGEVL